MAESSVQRRQVSLPGSVFPPIQSTSFSLNLPSPTFPVTLSPVPVSTSDSQTETSTTSPSSSTPSPSSTMTTTLPFSVLSTVTTTGSTLPTSVPNFAWSSYPSTMDTCTSVTLNWTYSGPQEMLQFVLISNASPHTQAATSRKRAGQSTTIATGVDSNALLFTWPKVNVTAGLYVLEATGTDVTVISSTFSIVNGADTSCLATTSSSSSSGYTSATSSATSSSSSSTMSSTALPASASSRSKGGAIAGGVVAGIAVLLAVVAAYVYFGLCRRRRPSSRRRGHGAMDDAPSLGQWGGLASRDSCMDVMGSSMGSKNTSPSKVARHGTSESTAPILTPLSSTAHGHHSSVTTLTATEEEKAVPYGKGYEYVESVPPLGYKASRRRSSASTYGLGQLSPIASIPEPPPSAGPQGRLRSKSASQSHRALALAKLDGADRSPSYSPSAPRRSIDASPVPPAARQPPPPHDMGFVPPPANRASVGGGRRAARKPVPALDSAELLPSPSSSPTSTGSPFAVPAPLSRGQSLASTVTMTSVLQYPTQPSHSREGALRPPTAAAPTRSRSREDLEAAGVELPTLDHKSSFGDRPVHYLIPDMPPPPK